MTNDLHKLFHETQNFFRIFSLMWKLKVRTSKVRKVHFKMGNRHNSTPIQNSTISYPIVFSNFRSNKIRPTQNTSIFCGFFSQIRNNQPRPSGHSTRWWDQQISAFGFNGLTTSNTTTSSSCKPTKTHHQLMMIIT